MERFMAAFVASLREGFKYKKLISLPARAWRISRA
jgi:hypothetical protein